MQDRHALWTPSIETEHLNPELAEFLKNVSKQLMNDIVHSRPRMFDNVSNQTIHLQVAINNEVLMAVSNINLAMPGGMLEVWMRNVREKGRSCCL